MTKIKNVQVGQYVLSYNILLGRYEYKKVLDKVNQGQRKVTGYQLEDGSFIECTPDHKILTKDNDYQPIDNLGEVCKINGLVKIINKTDKGQKVVYDITVENNHNFILKNGTIVKNCGAQTPFSSVNYGTCTSPEGRMVVQELLKSTEEGLGHKETPIFPVQIFKMKKGVNWDPGDPNYDLMKEAIKCSAKRLFPNFTYLDAPYNLQYYKPGKPETEVAVMGCRTRVLSNHFDPEHEQVTGRGNFAFCTLNLPRLGILAEHDLDKFWELYDKEIDLAIECLEDRFKLIGHKHVYNFPFLMGENIYLTSEQLNWEDEILEVIKQASISVGFIGLAECLVALVGKHHGESEEAQALGLKIVGHLRDRMDQKSEESGLNWSAFATPAEGLSGRFVKLDKKRFGVIQGVTDRDYYTNSSHVPVYYKTNFAHKIDVEAPYHALCNAGHIGYVEMDGDPNKNLSAYEQIVKYAGEKGMTYFSINTQNDRCPVCGYLGVIGDECPRCGFREGSGVSIEHLKACGCWNEVQKMNGLT